MSASTIVPNTTEALDRLERTLGRRHGLLLPPSVVPRLPADPRGVVHASVPREDDAYAGSAGGGVGTSRSNACIAAIAEALERYAASWSAIETACWDDVGPTTRIGFDEITAHSESQRTDPLLAGTGYRDEPSLAEVWRLHDGASRHVPAVLVGLTTDHGTLSTSSGLAAAFSLEQALLRGTQELIERDALMGTWLHQLPGREVEFEPAASDVTDLGGWLRAYDLTQQWSPHPVAAVVGVVPLDGESRFSMGLACRRSWCDAVAKAEHECLQGTVFAGYEARAHPEFGSLAPDDVVDFDRHAVYYTARPERIADLPLLQSGRGVAPLEPDPMSVTDELRSLVRRLAAAGIDVLARELTTIDLRQVGLRVVRVLAPSLTPIHHDHRLPFLGGTTPDRAWRYPDLQPLGPFPSPHPHPLG